MQIVYRRRESHKEFIKSNILVLKLQQDLETRNI